MGGVIPRSVHCRFPSPFLCFSALPSPLSLSPHFLSPAREAIPATTLRRKRRRRRPTPPPPQSAIVLRFVEERTMQGSSPLNPDASPFIPDSMSSFAGKAPEKQAESSSKGDISDSILDPLQYEEYDMDPVALVKSICSMFPNVSADFIDELLKANEFDIHLTIDMLHDLDSQDMVHNDTELGFPTFADANDLHEGQGLPGGDKHCAELSETDSSSNPNQVVKNEKLATTSQVKPVLPAFPKNNSVNNDLGLSNDIKSEGASVAN